MIEARINGYECDPGEIEIGTAGSYGVQQIHFAFSSEWEGLARRTTWMTDTGKIAVLLDENDTLTVPAEATATAGRRWLSVDGVAAGKQIISVRMGYKVYETVAPGGANSVPPTDEEMAQALAILEAVKALKTPGVEVGTTKTVEAGQPAKVTNSGTETKARFDFEIPRGESGVYVGSDEPDETAMIWIDPEGENDAEGVLVDLNAAVQEAQAAAAEAKGVVEGAADEAARIAAQAAVEETKDELGGYVSDAQTAKNQAAEEREGAEAARAAAESAESGALAAKTVAESAESGALAAQTAAEAAAQEAREAQEAAGTSETNAAASASAASASATKAASSASSANTAALDAEDAAANARQYSSSARSYMSNARTSAADAEASAADAANSASAAAISATDAANSAAEAANIAGNAGISAAEAANSAENAGISAAAAANSAEVAESAATRAEEAAAGIVGRWETVLETTWDVPVVTPTAYNAETGIFTCAEGELDALELNTKYTFYQQCNAENVAYNTILNQNWITLTKLSDTTFSIDVTPGGTFVATNVKFSKGASIAVTNIDTKKIRLTLDGQFKATATLYDRPFYGANVSYFGRNVGYTQIRNAYQAYQQVTAEVESPYRIVGEILCGFNAPSQNGSFHFKNNSFCCPLVPNYNKDTRVFSSDGQTIKNLYSTPVPWMLGSEDNTGLQNDYLKIIGGTKVKLERWVE